MSGPALEDYLAGIDAHYAPVVRALDATVRGAHPDVIADATRAAATARPKSKREG
jgi:hypothetical protein